jgi:osmoprotectant transport system substrate-binding protein
MKTWRRLLVLLLALGLVAAACGSDSKTASTTKTTASGSPGGSTVSKAAITVGSAGFSESTLVAAMYAQVLEHAGYDVKTKFNIGARELYFAALQKGEINLVPEFAGSLTVYLKGVGDADPAVALANLKKALPSGLTALAASPAQSANVFVVTKATADKYHLVAVSDLKDKGLTLGGPPECPSRPFCMAGLKTTYGIDFTDKFKPLDAGGPITKTALTKGDIDVALLFTTDPGIPKNGWVALKDDKHLQQAENVVPILQTKVVDAELTKLLDAVSAKLTQADYVALLGRIYIDGEDDEVVARSWLTDNGFLK